MYPSAKVMVLTWVGLSLSLVLNASAQTKEDVRKAFRNLRNDRVRYNCSRAAYWLYQRRELLRDQMLGELYLTKDPQERDALLEVLFVTKGFIPDERFARFVVNRLREEDTRCPKYWFLDPELADQSTPGPDLGGGAHHAAFAFMNLHYALFEQLLKNEILNSDDTWEISAIAVLMNARGALAENAELFTPEVLRKVGRSLKNDKVDYNASEAVRVFLLLGKRTLPVLLELSKSSDVQQASLARALTDYLAKKKKDGLGFVNANCYLEGEVYWSPDGSSLSFFLGANGLITKFSKENEEEPPEPAWIAQYTHKYDQAQKYP